MENVKSTLMPILKGILMALIVTLVVTLIFAGIIKLTEMKDGAIHFICQIIKAAAVLLGCLFGIKSGKAFFKGIAIGTVSMLAAYIIFKILDSKSIFDISILYEILFGAVAGGVSGFITGIIKKNKM